MYTLDTREVVMHHRLGAVNHIGIAVKNLEEAKKDLKRLKKG